MADKYAINFHVDSVTLEAIDKARGMVPMARWVRDIAIRNELQAAGFDDVARHMDENRPRQGRPARALVAPSEGG